MQFGGAECYALRYTEHAMRWRRWVLTNPVAYLIASSINIPEALMAAQPVYKVIFHNGNQVFEVFARQIYQSDMWGFIEIEEMLFGERSQIVVDPGEEKIKNEFAGVKRSYIPLQSVIRIDEVEKEGPAKVSDVPAGESSNKVANFPRINMPSPPASIDD
jgi:hypothetical protein